MKFAVLIIVVGSAIARAQTADSPAKQPPARESGSTQPAAPAEASAGTTPSAAPAEGAPVEPSADSSKTDPSDSGVKSASAAVPVPLNAFTIGLEDELYIRTLHEPDWTGPQEVRPDGMIQLQVIGGVKAVGLTPEQLAAVIREKLTSIIRNPEVSVQVSKVNSRKFTLQGEVNRPGTYTFASPVNVLEALVNGQGFRDFANVKKIYILRNGEKLKFNYKDVSHGKHMEQNVVVQNGDQIFVP